ncbi:WD40 and F-box-like and Pkinase domain containing protein [Trichuris trichiura]|uniref:non-specific serine/threonine protein kinase n=1 Tax=Trichuris trichiura TaxID=36087 RepID=A0A077YZ20_TRITR|nr:WD40 and F-box-like and Pkinase domain containing protein [Trichuris trichiura]
MNGNPDVQCSFVEKIDAFRGWWKEFNDEEKEKFAREILSCCGSMLAKSLAPGMDSCMRSYACVVHRSTDPFLLLPTHAIMKILSFLDPVSLCRCSMVSKQWMYVVNENNAWKRLCTDNKLYRLSSKQAEEKHALKFLNSDGEIRAMEIRSFGTLSSMAQLDEGQVRRISCVQFDDNYIVSGSSDKMIKVFLILVIAIAPYNCKFQVWDIRTNNHLAVMTLSGHSHTMDDEKIISGSYDRTLKVWDLVSSQCFETLRGHGAAVLCLQFDQEKIVSGSADDTIRVWDLRTCTCVMTMQKAHDAAVTCLQFNDRQIVSGSLDCTIKFWDVRTGRWLNTLDWVKHEGHTGVVRCLQADSWRIVSGADDKTMKARIPLSVSTMTEDRQTFDTSEGMKLIAQGAEAKLFHAVFLGRKVIVKERFPKSYRVKELDERLRKERLRAEIRSLLRCRQVGIPVPPVYFADASKGRLVLGFVEGSVPLKDVMPTLTSTEDKLSEQLGVALALMHTTSIIHGDLTSSNILVVNPELGQASSILLIDFGLSFVSSSAEDKAVDLFILEKTFAISHPDEQWFFESALQHYVANAKEGNMVLRKLEEVRMRGRKRDMVG